MAKPIRIASALVLGLAGAIATAAGALATPITYTGQTTASGSLNGVGFSNASITLTMMNNTASVTQPSSGLFENFGTITLNVSGFAPVTFTDETDVFSNQNVTTVGFTDQSVSDILDFDSTPFSTYALATSIGPISTAAGLEGGPFPTTGGAFEVTASSGTGTFTASTAIPEPSSIALLGVGLTGLGVIRRRKTGSANVGG